MNGMTTTLLIMSMNMKDFKNQRRGGCYWINGKPYLTVTTILKIIDKPALRYWFGKEVYLAMVKDPTLSQQEALAAPYKTSDKAKSRGLTVHSIVEAYKNVGKIKVAEDFKGYQDAFIKFITDTKAKILTQEKTVIDEENRFAGTLDMLAEINGKEVIIDVKTGKDIYPEAFLQLSAYAHASGNNCDIAVLLLKDNGKYKFEYGEKDLNSFLACKKIYENIHREDLLKIGYL